MPDGAGQPLSWGRSEQSLSARSLQETKRGDLGPQSEPVLILKLGSGSGQKQE